MSRVEPWRTGSDAARPDVPLPPGRMPLLRGRRPLKRWHYVACFDRSLMLCAAWARIGPLPVAWWAVWDRDQRTLAERTVRGRSTVELSADRLAVDDGSVRIELELGSAPAVETVSPHGAGYAWTRKQGGVPMRGSVAIGDRRHDLDARGVVDESAGYHARETRWTWSAGVGEAAGRPVAWNLVAGLHDAEAASERSVWAGPDVHEVGPVRFEGLEAIAFAEGQTLRFEAEATRARRDDLGLLLSAYEQPFGSFTGDLPGAGRLDWGLGVMERHEARW